MSIATINGEMWLGTTGEITKARRWLNHKAFSEMTDDLKKYVLDNIGVKFFVRDPELFNGVILPVGEDNKKEFLAKAKEQGTTATYRKHK